MYWIGLGRIGARVDEKSWFAFIPLSSAADSELKISRIMCYRCDRVQYPMSYLQPENPITTPRLRNAGIRLPSCTELTLKFSA